MLRALHRRNAVGPLNWPLPSTQTPVRQTTTYCICEFDLLYFLYVSKYRIKNAYGISIKMSTWIGSSYSWHTVRKRFDIVHYLLFKSKPWAQINNFTPLRLCQCGLCLCSLGYTCSQGRAKRKTTSEVVLSQNVSSQLSKLGKKQLYFFSYVVEHILF